MVKIIQNKALTIVANKKTNQEELILGLLPFITINEVKQVNNNVWKISCDTDTVITGDLRNICYKNHWDFALQDENPSVKKLFMSDMDATIVVGETIDDMAKSLGIYDEISSITEKAMQGKMDYKVALKERLCLLKGIHKDIIIDIAENTVIANGADKLLDNINKRGMDSCLISSGFSIFTETIARKLGFKRHISNILSFDNKGNIDGTWLGSLVTGEVKKDTLITIAQNNNIRPCETIVIGDGANDIKMIKEAGLGVAFYAKPAVRKISQAEIHSGSIDNLLWFI